jgi:hypothetical protein
MVEVTVEIVVDGLMDVNEFIVMLFAAFGVQPNLCICVRGKISVKNSSQLSVTTCDSIKIRNGKNSISNIDNFCAYIHIFNEFL